MLYLHVLQLPTRISEQDQRLQHLQDSLFDEEEVSITEPSRPGGAGRDVETGDITADAPTGAFASPVSAMLHMCECAVVLAGSVQRVHDETAYNTT